jgi:hypothetical protein
MEKRNKVVWHHTKDGKNVWNMLWSSCLAFLKLIYIIAMGDLKNYNDNFDSNLDYNNQIF